MRYRILIFLALSLIICIANAQRKVPFNGILTDINEKPIKKALIYINSNTKKYTQTNKEGKFGLTNIGANDTLKIVLNKQVFQVPVEGKRSMKISLDDEKNIIAKEDEKLLNWGFGFVNRREYSGSSNIISGDELRKSGYHDVISALQGRVPGLDISGAKNQGSNMDVSIRGNRSFTASSAPIYILDNIKVASLEGLSLNDIDYVEVLKDASAYGSDGGNGAIIVFTKMSSPK